MPAELNLTIELQGTAELSAPRTAFRLFGLAENCWSFAKQMVGSQRKKRTLPNETVVKFPYRPNYALRLQMSGKALGWIFAKLIFATWVVLKRLSRASENARSKE